MHTLQHPKFCIQQWWARGRHVRQKELAPSAKVRRTTPEVVRAPPRHLSSSPSQVLRGRWEGGVAPSQGVALNRLWDQCRISEGALRRRRDHARRPVTALSQWVCAVVLEHHGRTMLRSCELPLARVAAPLGNRLGSFAPAPHRGGGTSPCARRRLYSRRP